MASEVAQAPVEAVEEVMGGAQPQSELPPIASCDPLKLQAARDIIPGKTISPVNLTGWAPAKTKPRKQELMRAILERDSSQRCKHWSVEKCVHFLLETPPAVIAAAIGAAPDPAAAAPAAAPAAAQQPTQNREEGPTDTSSRWSKFKDVRLLHAIAENRAQFVARDRKLTRAELDAGARHACWEDVCKTFNSQQEFAILASQEAADKFASFGSRCLPTSYVLERDKAMKEFGSLRTQLTKCLVNFRRSGMGTQTKTCAWHRLRRGGRSGRSGATAPGSPGIARPWYRDRPTGGAGVLAWLARDVRVFRNVFGVGAAVPRPAMLWDSE